MIRTLLPSLLVACGGPVATTAPAPTDACLRFSSEPVVVNTPGPFAPRSTSISAAPDGGWVVAWRNEGDLTLQARRLDPTLFPLDRAPVTVWTGADGYQSATATERGVLMAWSVGATLQSWWHDPALVGSGPRRSFQLVDRVAPTLAQSLTATRKVGLGLIWHGDAVAPPFSLWDLDDDGTIPKTLPGTEEGRATGPGALAADSGAFYAAWPQQAQDGAWALRMVRIGATTPIDLVALPGRPDKVLLGAGDGLVAAWTFGGEVRVQRAGLAGAPIGDPLTLGRAGSFAVAVSGPNELVAWADGRPKLRRLDLPGCSDLDAGSGLRGEVALAMSGAKGVIVWEGVGPAGGPVVWGRPFEVLTPPPKAP